jgi:hypothetical protein
MARSTSCWFVSNSNIWRWRFGGGRQQVGKRLGPKKGTSAICTGRRIRCGSGCLHCVMDVKHQVTAELSLLTVVVAQVCAFQPVVCCCCVVCRGRQ